MEYWSADQIRDAVSDRAGAGDGAVKLRRLLADVKTGLPGPVHVELPGIMSSLSQLELQNPPEVEGVWIATGYVESPYSTVERQLTAVGFTQADSLNTLVHEVALVKALARLGSTNNSTKIPVAAHTALSEYSRKLIENLPPSKESKKTLLPIRHIGNRLNTGFPKVLFSETVPGVLPPLTEGCAVSFRQRSAIDRALCRKTLVHASVLWRSGRMKPRKVTSEVQAIFDYYSQKCIRKNSVDVTLLDISLGWGPQVFVIVSIGQKGRVQQTGCGCGQDSHTAIANALLDLCHKEFLIHRVVEKTRIERNVMLTGSEKIALDEQQSNRKLPGNSIVAGRDSTKEVFWPLHTFARRVAVQAETAGVDLFYSDITPPASALSVVKIISPQLLSSTEPCVDTSE